MNKYLIALFLSFVILFVSVLFFFLYQSPAPTSKEVVVTSTPLAENDNDPERQRKIAELARNIKSERGAYEIYNLPLEDQLAVARVLMQSTDIKERYSGASIFVLQGKYDEAVPTVAEILLDDQVEKEFNGRIGYDWEHAGLPGASEFMVIKIARYYLLHYKEYDPVKRQKAFRFLCGEQKQYCTADAQGVLTVDEDRLRDELDTQEKKLLAVIQPKLDEINRLTDAYEKKMSGTKIIFLDESPVLGPQGNPLGVRMNFSVEVPVDGEYDFSYFFNERYLVQTSASDTSNTPGGIIGIGYLRQFWSLDGEKIEIEYKQEFKAGKKYTMTYELLPIFFKQTKPDNGPGITNAKNFCIHNYPEKPSDPLSYFNLSFILTDFLLNDARASELKVNYSVQIVDNQLKKYYVFSDGKDKAVTKNSYAPKLFFENAKKEGIPFCDDFNFYTDLGLKYNGRISKETHPPKVWIEGIRAILTSPEIHPNVPFEIVLVPKRDVAQNDFYSLTGSLLVFDEKNALKGFMTFVPTADMFTTGLGKLIRTTGSAISLPAGTYKVIGHLVTQFANEDKTPKNIIEDTLETELIIK